MKNEIQRMQREQHGAEQQLDMHQRKMQDAQVMMQQTQANLANTTNAATEYVQNLQKQLEETQRKKELQRQQTETIQQRFQKHLCDMQAMYDIQIIDRDAQVVDMQACVHKMSSERAHPAPLVDVHESMPNTGDEMFATRRPFY